jgi:hypothetical protein
VNSTELLARMPSQLGGRLEVCSCGHTPEAHPGRGGCRHRNRASQKRGLPAAQCECGRFTPDPRLPDGEVFVRRVLQKVLAKEQIPAELVELEDALSVLIRQLWITCDKYDSRSHVRFRVYAYLELYNDAIDHFRSERGRHGQHRVYDPRANGNGPGDGDDPAQPDRLDGTASRDPADDPDNWATDAGGLLKGGDGSSSGLAA